MSQPRDTVDVSYFTMDEGDKTYLVMELHPVGKKPSTKSEQILSTNALCSTSTYEEGLMTAVKAYLRFTDIERMYCIVEDGKTTVTYSGDPKDNAQMMKELEEDDGD